MKPIRIISLLVALIFTVTGLAQRKKNAAAASAPQAQQSQQRPAPRVVDLKASDGTVLKASYFAAAKPGPGVSLAHQVDQTRKAWEEVAEQLAELTDAEAGKVWRGFPGDIETAFQFLVSQPGAQRDVIGMGGAGLLGVDNSVEVARHHPAMVKSLALLSGETFQDGLQFLRRATQLPGLFVVSDDDEYPPTVEAMELLYITSSNPGKKLVHYSAMKEAPWLWYEPVNVGTVPATGGHGTDLFKSHPELPGIIVQWFVTTLIQTPGHAPADTVASAAILVRMPGGVAAARQQLLEARQKDSQAQLWPETTLGIIGADHMRLGESRLAVEILELNVLAYPDSADANDNLADA